MFKWFGKHGMQFNMKMFRSRKYSMVMCQLCGFFLKSVVFQNADSGFKLCMIWNQQIDIS